MSVYSKDSLPHWSTNVLYKVCCWWGEDFIYQSGQLQTFQSHQPQSTNIWYNTSHKIPDHQLKMSQMEYKSALFKNEKKGKRANKIKKKIAWLLQKHSRESLWTYFAHPCCYSVHAGGSTRSHSNNPRLEGIACAYALAEELQKSSRKATTDFPHKYWWSPPTNQPTCQEQRSKHHNCKTTDNFTQNCTKNVALCM